MSQVSTTNVSDYELSSSRYYVVIIEKIIFTSKFVERIFCQVFHLSQLVYVGQLKKSAHHVVCEVEK